MFILSYPDFEQKAEMVKALLSRWKFLERELETFTDTLRPWRNRLVTYYKNQRFRCKLDIPEILQKRAVYRKRKGENEESIPVKQIHQVWGVPNFLPYFEEGEDNQSMNHHSEVLKSQSRLSEERRNKDTIRILTEKTFPDRCQILINEYKHIREVLEKYPLLCS